MLGIYIQKHLPHFLIILTIQLYESFTVLEERGHVCGWEPWRKDYLLIVMSWRTTHFLIVNSPWEHDNKNTVIVTTYSYYVSYTIK